MTQTVAVVLAAGLGKRMKSKKPKVLHEIAGVPLIKHILEAVEQVGVAEIFIVLGHQGEKVREVLGEAYRYVEQKEQLGTGHAVRQAGPGLDKYAGGNCLVLCGDTPLLKKETLQDLLAKHSATKAGATILTALLDDPTGYGRIIRKHQGVAKIVEEKEATAAEKKVREINTGTYCFAVNSLSAGLEKLTAANTQGEYYLTDVIEFLGQKNERVETFVLANPLEALGVNNRLQLAVAETHLRQEIIREHMLQGVTVKDPAHVYLERNVKIGPDTVLYPGVILEGETVIGANCQIGPSTRIINSQIGDDCQVDNSFLREVKVGRGCLIGPYSYLRPGTELADNVKIGDFVEVKNSRVGQDSKIPHLSYIGDSFLGEDVNIGAGTITCNYDGETKNQTLIEDRAFIGSNTNLVAPVKVGRAAYIGAGSTITRDVPADSLALARGKQKNLLDWPSKKRKQEEN